MWKKTAKLIELPHQVVETLSAVDIDLNSPDIKNNIYLLVRPEASLDARNALKALLPEDGGFSILLCMLEAAGITYAEYKNEGIPEKIYIDTMKCFTRFIKEHKESYGEYGFDRDFWTWRQLSLRLFRIGELEYEKCLIGEDKEKFISMHIPSDAVISRENCLESYKMSKEFFKRFYPDFENVPNKCSSWLLSPELKELLPENSRILQFQQLFEIENTVNKGANNFLEWVYKRKDIPIDQLPEQTTLQRNMKKYLLAGGLISEGEGIFKY